MIRCVAIKMPNYTHFAERPARHHNLMWMMLERGEKPPIAGEQGFMTHDLRFVDRVEAGKIAIECGQIDALKWPNNLYSEDLW